MHRTHLARYLMIASVVAPVLMVLVCVIFRHAVGRPLYFSLYFAPAVGAFLLSISCRLLESRPYGVIRGLIDGLVILLCSLRATAPLVPMSGHMLFFVYGGLTIRSRLFRVVTVVLIIQTSIIKLVLWRDYWSWFLGIASGVLLAGMFVWLPGGRPKAGQPASTM